MEKTSLRRGRLDIALTSVLYDAGLRVPEAAALCWRDILDSQDGAGLVYIERSKTDQVGESAYVVITPDTLTALKWMRQEVEGWTADGQVFGLSESKISRRSASMARAAGLGKGYSGHSGRVGLAIRMTNVVLRFRRCRLMDDESCRLYRHGTPGARRRLNRWSGFVYDLRFSMTKQPSYLSRPGSGRIPVNTGPRHTIEDGQQLPCASGESHHLRLAGVQ